MKEVFKISSNYWNKLQPKEKFFLQVYACKFGVRYCKRIISLSRYLPEWDDITNYNEIETNESYKLILPDYWVVTRNNKVVGMIYKGSGGEISEKIDLKRGDNWVNLWNNRSSKNPSRNELNEL